MFGLGATAIRSVVVVLIVGLLPVLIFAWAFEISPEGLKRASEADRSQSITPQTNKKLDRVIMGALALGYFAIDTFVLAPQREQAATEAGRAEGLTESLVKSYGDKSIAVLPFVNMSADKDQPPRAWTRPSAVTARRFGSPPGYAGAHSGIGC